VQTVTQFQFQIHFNIIIRFLHISSKWILPQVFLAKSMHAFLATVRSTGPAHPIPLSVLTATSFG
jgi:hypothetical protein